ncbi:hypothetical protein IPL68_00355 [Candidatus Saccharibacteria bacterium]|nr:MAG: hypothetical protein IPL68_00355 [Candidatus Saccharibacteria bacterium]
MPKILAVSFGKRGATAQSIRTLLRALGTKQEARYNLKIVDVDRLDENGNPLPRPEREDRSFAPRRDDNQSTSDAVDGAGVAAVAAPATVAAVAPTTMTNDDDDDLDAVEAPKPSDSVARTRAELADLDDLDI